MEALHSAGFVEVHFEELLPGEGWTDEERAAAVEEGRRIGDTIPTESHCRAVQDAADMLSLNARREPNQVPLFFAEFRN